MNRRGFTLFEIVFALLLVALAVVTAMALVGTGMRGQAMARYRVYAATKALELTDLFATFHTANPATDGEAPNPWDVHIAGQNLSFDLEHRLSSYRTGLYPLPSEIAGRLDSDGDEIARILAAGGQIFYSQPMAAANYKSVVAFENDGTVRTIDMPPPNESQKVVCAIVGEAQSNAIPVLPWKAWPYYVSYPSPPMAVGRTIGNWGDHETNGIYEFEARKFALRDDAWIFPNLWSKPNTVVEITSTTNDRSEGQVLMEDQITGDLDIRNVWFTRDQIDPDDPEGPIRRNWGYLDYRMLVDFPAAKRYLRAALWYCARKGVSPGDYDGVGLSAFPNNGVDDAVELRALRFLAHAAACLTAHGRAQAAPPPPLAPWNLETGVAIPATTLTRSVLAPAAPGSGGFSATAPAYTIDEAKIRALHENCLRLAHLHAASSPYNWGAPRPRERATMMDHPLLEWDLFSGTLDQQARTFSGGVPGVLLTPLTAVYQYNAVPRFALKNPPAGTPTPGQWRPIAAEPVTNPGSSLAFPRIRLPAEGDADSIWGDRAHFTLTRPFSGAERCRQLVFWAVDWQSYEDCETAPSAPVDAHRYPKWIPILYRWGTSNHDNYLRPDPRWQDWHQFGFRNPELPLLFVQDMSAVATGTVLRVDNPWSGGVFEGQTHGPDKVGGNQIDHSDHTARNNEDTANVTLDARSIFVGRWGADRNFNGRLDRGPVPRSTRLRAVTVARYNLYDPRIPVPQR
jgi:hypothetical protein